MNDTAYLPNWDLSSLFPGEETPEQILEKIHAGLGQLEQQIDMVRPFDSSIHAVSLAGIVRSISKLQLSFSQILSYTTCLLAEAPGSELATSLRGKAIARQTRFSALFHRFQQNLSQVDEAQWKSLLKDEALQEVSFILQEWRGNGGNLNRAETADSQTAAYYSLGQEYWKALGGMRVNFRLDGNDTELSIGQATNLRSHSDGAIRKGANAALAAACKQEETTMAGILNGIAGFRLDATQKQGASPLEASLRANRSKQESLDAMWHVVRANKQPFAEYLQWKAKLLGKRRLAAYDFWAPVNDNALRLDYAAAAAFLLERFGEFGTEMHRFARHAFSNGWIEAENRPGKSAVAFCASFPETGESRVFLTYDGSFTNLLTLAHELGHAFHNRALKDENGIFRKYPLCLAETASTFTEMIVLDSALEKAESKEEKLFLLDEKIKRSTMNFMNLHARFVFEEKLYEERESGELPPSRLNGLMQDSLTEAYAGAMDELPVHSWITTPHFYITGSPFYNYPYTFGYLFAVSLYAKAREEGAGFEKQYMALLRDSGKMPAEELVMKHLGEDIESTDFWEKGMKSCIEDVEAFIELASAP